jgi:type II secretory pathway component PulF
MKEFRYSALTTNGTTVTGIRRSESRDALASDLLASGLVLLKTKPSLGAVAQLFSPAGRFSRRELRDFTQHMATCLTAGITAVTALDDFQKQSDGAFAEVIADIKGDVSSGNQLDEAFARHPQVFPPVYLALVKAGQNSGNLDNAFEELVAYLEWNENLRGQATQALIYPALLLTAIIGLFLLMMLFVIPRFSGIFDSLDTELPALTVAVLNTGKFMGHWWWLILGGLAASFISIRLFFNTDRGQLVRDQLLLKTPVLGGFVHKIALSRFAKTFSLIFASGIDLLQLLNLVQEVVNNKVMTRELARIRSRVASGETLTTSFNDSDSFPILIKRLISVGEKTGSLDTSLMKASEYLDKEIPRDLKKAFTIFEALVIALLGVLVCVAALSLLMPIMSIRGDM